MDTLSLSDPGTRSRMENLILLGVLLFTVGINFSPLLTNEYSPRGDGARVVPYVEFVENARDVFPLWNPWKLGGVPTLATPERYVWVSAFIDADSPWVNLQFNVLMLGAGCAFLALSFVLARALGCSRRGALFAVIVLANSYLLQTLLMNGRINGVQALCSVLAASILYVGWVRRGGMVRFASTAVFTGLAVCDYTPYVLVTYYPLVFMFHLSSRWREGAWMAIAKAVFASIAVTLVGITVFAVFFATQVYYLFTQLHDYSTLTTLSDWLSLPATLPGLFLPVFYSLWPKDTSYVYPYLTIALLPLVWFGARRGLLVEAGALSVSIWLLGSLALMSAAFVGAFDAVRYLGEVPILQHIRHNFGLLVAVSISGSILCGLLYERCAVRVKAGLAGYLAPLAMVAGVFLLGAIGQIMVDPDYRYARIGYRYLIERWTSLPSGAAAGSVLMLALLCCPYPRLRTEGKVRAYLIALILLQPLLVPFTELSRMVTNRSPYPEIARVLRGDPTYFRVWDASFRPQNELGAPRVRNLTGYSKYFSAEHRRALEGLLGLPVTALRPAWVTPRIVAAPNMAVLERLNIKYLVIRIADRVRMAKVGPHNFLEKGWQKVVEDAGHELWRRDDWRPQLFIAAQANAVDDPEEAAELASRRAAGDTVIFVETQSSLARSTATGDDIELQRFSEDEVVLRVRTANRGYLFLSEYWARDWHATVNGHDSPVIRANGVFRAVMVDPGTSEVVFRYKPSIVSHALGISAAAAALLLIVSVMPKIWTVLGARRRVF